MIQLVFEGGIESPVFDSERENNENQVETYNVRDSAMTELKMGVSGNWLTHLLVSYHDD